MSNEAFVTLATNDSYGLGALVLGRSLRRVATSKQTVVLVTPDVSQKMKDELAHVFNLVVTVDTLDSGDDANLALMLRPELGVTFTKLHAWRLVQFSKCVFLDADTLVVQNCDELFEREELSAAPDPGWPDCFNSGVFVFVPSEATFKALMDFAVAHGSFDGGDQGLLNMFFSGWATGDIRKHLPFIYNVVSSATYSYLPALKHFGSQVKIAHFLGSNKPWLRQSQVGTSSPYQRAWWSIFREDVACRLSQDMIVARPLTGSSTISNLLPRYRFKDPWDFVRYENEDNRRHSQSADPQHQNPGTHSQISFIGEESKDPINQFIKHSLPNVSESFVSNTGTVSTESPYLTTQTPEPRNIENFKYQYHNYDQGNAKTVENNIRPETTATYMNYSIRASESKTALKNNIKSFHIQTENNNNSNDKANENVAKPTTNSKELYHQSTMNITKCNIEKKNYQMMENNPIGFSLNQTSFPKSEEVRTSMIPSLTQNIPTSRSANSKVNEAIDKTGSVMKIDQEKIKSDHCLQYKITDTQNNTTSRTKTSEAVSKIYIGDSATKINHEKIRSDRCSQGLQPKNSNADNSFTIANEGVRTVSNQSVLLSAGGIKILHSETRIPKSEKQRNLSNSFSEQKIAQIENGIGSNCSNSQVGAGTVNPKPSKCKKTKIPTDKTSNKTHDYERLAHNNTPQSSCRPSCDENKNQNNAGVAGVLAAGEPDDWRREAWEAGDVDYLGRDSFDNIWRRICECVGITAQTLSAPAAPAATSAGIVNQPSAPVPVSEELIVPVSVAKPAGPLTEKPAEPATHPEKPTESVTSAEKPAEPPVSVENPAEAIISVEKQVEPAVCPVKPVEPVVSTEKPVEPVVSTEKSVEPVVSTEKPVEPVLSTEKPVEPVVLAEKIVEPEVSAAKPAETVVSREKPTELVSVEKPAETAVSTDKPKEIVSAEKPTEPVVSAQKSVEPVVSLGKPAETVVTPEKPVEPITTSEKLPETVVEKPSELSAILEKQTPLSEKLPEAAPVTDKTTTTVDKDKTAEITPTKAVEIPEGKIVEPTSAEEKSAKQKAPEKEKPLETDETSAVPVAIMPAKTATAEKPEEPAIILKEQPKEVQAEKKVDPAPTLEKPVDVPPTAETPAGKSGEHTPESVKPKETPAAAEVCPLKPSEPKSSATETPVGGEARIQPPLVAGEAPACKKEPGTPTITPPSGPGSPQPADTPPEVCKLQATPSQPATPPASSHQTADAPVPPKRKQGKNGKSGKGKK